jgi:ATP-dependent Clp protease protease subunit
VTAVDQLFARRTVLVATALDDQTASRVAAELMTLDALGDDPIDLWVNCSGGTFDAALAVMDVIDLLGVSVHATCLGRAQGPAVGVLAVAHHRAAAPHAHLRFDAPSSSIAGPVSAVVRAAEELRRRHDEFCCRVALASGHRPEWVDDALRTRRSFEPIEAVRAGLLDEIAPARAASVSGLFSGGGGTRPRSR